jgi:hypothetical protein
MGDANAYEAQLIEDFQKGRFRSESKQVSESHSVTPKEVLAVASAQA